jgi:Na+-driven multidrug efflux pump
MQIAASAVTILSNYSLLMYGGQVAVAAFGIINRVGMLILMPIFGISQGVQPILGYNYGAKKYERVTEVMKLGIYAATLVAILGFVVVQLFPMQIIRLFNDNQELISLGASGLTISLALLPIIGFQIIGASFFQAAGKAGHAVFLSMSRQVIILIPALIILPRFWGLSGIWLALPTSDSISALLTGAYLWLELRRMSPKLLENNS